MSAIFQKLKQNESLSGLVNMLKKLRNLYYYFEEKRIIHIYNRKMPHLIEQIKEKETINVVFFASAVSLWRYQRLYEAMIVHHRFHPMVVLSPTNLYDEHQREVELDQLRCYFDKKKVEYIDFRKGKSIINIEKDLHADIVFYPQPYRNFLIKEHDFISLNNVLLAYYPYAFWNSNKLWGYNLVFHNIAWKLFYSTEIHKKNAEKWSDNQGKNVAIVGYPNADDFLLSTHHDVWKPQQKMKKRVIWAPHFTIFHENNEDAHSNFLEMADFMKWLSDKYQDDIQFAFKPHPRLKTELYNYKKWGKVRTDDYYNYWNTAPNCQLEEGDFIDLFMTSDAMIHDSGSFSTEYHYTLNPVMYVTKDVESEKRHLCKFGKLSMDLHYIGKDNRDILTFLEKRVMLGVDEMRPLREKFYKDYLLPPNGKSVSENTIDNILNALS